MAALAKFDGALQGKNGLPTLLWVLFCSSGFPAAAAPLFPNPALTFGGQDPRSVAVADLNADGYQDLVTANWVSGDVSVLLGRGDGSFAAAMNVAADGAMYVISEDFNGDMTPDLAVASSNAVSILLGRGDGTFLLQRRFGAGEGALSVAVGDFNSVC
jgi:hypothetical protein